MPKVHGVHANTGGTIEFGLTRPLPDMRADGKIVTTDSPSWRVKVALKLALKLALMLAWKIALMAV